MRGDGMGEEVGIEGRVRARLLVGFGLLTCFVATVFVARGHPSRSSSSGLDLSLGNSDVRQDLESTWRRDRLQVLLEAAAVSTPKDKAKASTQLQDLKAPAKTKRPSPEQQETALPHDAQTRSATIAQAHEKLKLQALQESSNETTGGGAPALDSHNGVVEDADDKGQNRSIDAVFDQILRIPLTHHIFRTAAHYMQDRQAPMRLGTPNDASAKPHKNPIFDSDVITPFLNNETATPMPASQRDPQYYPGGDFVDTFRDARERTGFTGGFGDVSVPQNKSLAMNVSRIAEMNFEDVADDAFVHIPPAVQRHPRPHIGEEYDAGGYLSDKLEHPAFFPNPMDADRLATLGDEEAAGPPTVHHGRTGGVELGDRVVGGDEEFDSRWTRDLGLATRPHEATRPHGEVQYRYGLMHDFQDRNVDEGSIEDAARQVAGVWGDRLKDLWDGNFPSRHIEVRAPTLPKTEDEEGGSQDAGAAPGGTEAEEGGEGAAAAASGSGEEPAPEAA